jgi:hypothetical protein
LCLYLAFALFACTSKSSSNNSADSTATEAQPADNNGGKGESADAKGRREHAAHKEAKREPIIVPAGTPITINLSSAIGSKLSKTGDTFSGSVAQDVTAGNAVAIPKGAGINGTVTDAKALGKLKGGAVLEVRLDSVNIHGSDVPVQAAAKSFTEKGKGKRTAVLAGGGAALGGIIGALAGGGKGAAIGAAAGAGAGTGGAAFTGNKEIVLPAESDLTFELSQPLEIKR